MFHVQVLDEVISTQESVRDAVDLREGLVIRAVLQIGGRGRHGRIWDGLEGNLFASIALKPARSLSEVGGLSLVISIALARAIGQRAQLKWPNDLLIERQKCAGILCEVVGEFVIAGLGVNVKEAPDGCVALSDGRDAARVLDDFLIEFEPLYALWQRDGFAGIKNQWLALAHPVGTPMSVKRADAIVEGVFAGLGDDGALLLEGANGGITTITAGELYVTSD